MGSAAGPSSCWTGESAAGPRHSGDLLEVPQSLPRRLAKTPSDEHEPAFSRRKYVTI
jgi:hypothetical protein